MKIKVRTIIKNLAMLLLLPVNLLVITPLITYLMCYVVHNIYWYLLGYEDYWTFSPPYHGEWYFWASLIGISLLIISVLIKNKTTKNIIRNIGVLLLAILNAYWLHIFGLSLIWKHYYQPLEYVISLWIPLFAFILLAIYCLMWLAEQSKGKIMIVNE
ncbi:MAG: hypothetical protein ACPLKS_08060 [Caldisericum exile]|uniref:hypothetical protein n=1 Tax=Caldisericum exile TaxID=693075 RepID=UPI003C76C6D6